jgi:hypothetical protein
MFCHDQKTIKKEVLEVMMQLRAQQTVVLLMIPISAPKRFIVNNSLQLVPQTRTHRNATYMNHFEASKCHPHTTTVKGRRK